MSLYSAMQSGVSGLFAQSTRMAAISDNISNSSTVGYKRADVDFSRLVTPQMSASSYTAGGVTTSVQAQITRPGNILASTVSTNMAVAGRGFFMVSNESAGTGNQSMAMTRAGAFAPDENGNLRNTAGFFLQGWPIDNNGVPTGNTLADLRTVNIGGFAAQGAATTEINFAGNLPSQTTGAGYVAGTTFTTNVEFYSPLGERLKVKLDWLPTATANSWTLRVTPPAGYSPVADQTVSFHPSGPTAGAPTADIVANLVPDPAITPAVVGPVAINLGSADMYDGVTQFAGDYTPSKIAKDGAAAAEVSRVEVSETGIVYAIFENGTRRAAYQVPLADVANVDGLKPIDGNAYVTSSNSGDLRIWNPGDGPVGEIAGAALEASNVDIAEELTALIETQRAYSSNAKIVQTADEMLEETTRLKR